MDSSEQPHSNRISAIYQYHNAPEVAPAHGLEYDDTIYPSSDKYPVVHSAQYHGSYTGKHALDPNNRPPRIIFGMKVRTFLVVAAVVVCVLIGASVGGAVGGKSMHNSGTQDGITTGVVSNSSSSAASSAPTAKSSSTASTALTPTSTTTTAPVVTPTILPLSDCPSSNDTSYTSNYAQGTSGTVPSTSALNFTKYCDFSSPLSQSSSHTITEAFVYTFDDCIEVCAGYNFWGAGSNCTVAVYDVSGSRPGNCWVGYAEVNSPSQLTQKTGTDVALISQ